VFLSKLNDDDNILLLLLHPKIDCKAKLYRQVLGLTTIFLYYYLYYYSAGAHFFGPPCIQSCGTSDNDISNFATEEFFAGRCQSPRKRKKKCLRCTTYAIQQPETL